MKVTKEYLKKIIKEELNVTLGETEQIEEALPGGAIAGAGLALFMAVTGLKAAEATSRFQQIYKASKIIQQEESTKDLEQFFLSQGNKEVPKNMSHEDLALYKAGKEYDQAKK